MVGRTESFEGRKRLQVYRLLIRACRMVKGSAAAWLRPAFAMSTVGGSNVKQKTGIRKAGMRTNGRAHFL